MNPFLSMVTFLLAAHLMTFPASAQDKCSDVLTKPPLDITSFKDHHYYYVYQLATLNSNAAQSSSRSAGLNLGAFQLTGKETQNVLSSLSRRDELQKIVENSTSFLQTYGSERVVGAWSACMIRGGVFQVRFEPQPDPTDVQLHIEYNKAGGIHPPAQESLTLASKIEIPVSIISDPTNCLKEGKTYDPGENCIVSFKTPSAWTAFGIQVNLKGKGNFSTSAYLAPRAKLDFEEKAWSKQIQVSLHSGPRGRTDVFDADLGYRFVADSVKSSVLDSPGNNCADKVTVDETGQKITMYIEVATVSGAWEATHQCTLTVTVKEIQPVWIPPN